MTAAPIDPLMAIAYAAAFLVTALVTRRRPVYGLCLLIAVEPFALYGAADATTVTLPKAALMGLLLGLCDVRMERTQGVSRAARAIGIAGLAVLAATLLSMAHAHTHAPVLRESLKLVEYLLAFGAAIAAFARDPDETPIIATLAALTVLVGLLALSQEFVGAHSALLIGGRVVPRIAGPLEGPNQLAGWFDVMIPALGACAVARPRAWIGPALALAVCADVLTFSRGGALGALAGLLAIGFTYRAEIRALAAPVVSGLIAGVAVAAAWATVAHSLGIFRLWNFESTYAGGVGTRPELWRAAWTLWREHPIFGVGAGNFELEIPLTGLHGVKTHANSLYLQALVEGGIPLFAATLWLVIASIASFARDRLRSPFVAAAFAASIALAIHQIVDYLVFYPKVGELWWIVMGIACA